MTAVGEVPGERTTPTTAAAETPWRRLHGRLIWVNGARFLLSLTPTFVSVFVFNTDKSLAASWPAMVATAIGLGISIGDVVRWLRTRYRVTDELVEIRTGRIVRVYRQIPRDRIRTVDIKSRLRHRLAGLRVVFVSAGRNRPAVKLDAVSKPMALALQRELMGSAPRTAETTDVADVTEAGDAGNPAEPAAKPVEHETPIARFRLYWLFYNVINIWGFLVGFLMLWSLHSMLVMFGFDLVGRTGDVINHLAQESSVRKWAYWGVVVGVLGHFALVSGFIKENWRFELARVHKEEGTFLLTRYGLLSTREVHRDDTRLRGMHLSEPFCWRWIGLVETTVVATGLATFSLKGEPSASILPRAPVSEARRAAAMVLPGPERPLEAPLRRHPGSALARRLAWAVLVPGVLSGLLWWLGATDAMAPWVWSVPLWGLPLTVLLAVPAYRALGHTLIGRYFVLRCGLSRRQTVALRRDAVIGMTMRQSLLQRGLGLITMGVATAAGERMYRAPDMGVEQFLDFAEKTVPTLWEEFLEPVPETTPRKCR